MKLGKPERVPYARRLERYSDEVWLIWSNKWNCWYRPKAQGYTDDIARAGLFDRRAATLHMQPPGTPRKHRDTEPFPISVVRAHLKDRRARFEQEAAETRAALDEREAYLAATTVPA